MLAALLFTIDVKLPASVLDQIQRAAEGAYYNGLATGLAVGFVLGLLLGGWIERRRT